MKKSCKRGYKKVGNTCKRIIKRKISKKEGRQFLSLILGFITYAMIGEPITKWVDNTFVSMGLRIFLGLFAFGLFYYFFQND